MPEPVLVPAPLKTKRREWRATKSARRAPCATGWSLLHRIGLRRTGFHGIGDGIVDVLEEDELELLSRFGRHFLDVPAISRRQHDPPDAGTHRGQYLVLDAAH